MLSVVEAREQQIITLLQQPMTMEQMRDALGLNIHTLRRTVAAMQERGMVKPTGQVVNKKPTYIVASVSPVPQLYHRTLNKHLHPVSIVRGYVSANGKSAAAEAAAYLNKALATLLYYATQDNVNAQELDSVRAALKDAAIALSASADMIQQVLSTPQWWSKSGLSAMTNDSEFDADEVIRLYSTIVSNNY